MPEKPVAEKVETPRSTKRPIKEIEAELELCSNALSTLRLEDADPKAPALTSKKREKMKKLAYREKELESELKKAKRYLELIELGEELRTAASKDNVARVKEICKLPDAKKCVDSENFEGTTSLIKAAMYDRVEMVDALIGAGANIDHTDQKGRTALMMAAANGAQASVERLLSNGATVSICATNGWTAFMFAAEGGSAPVCKLLHEGGHVTSVADLLVTSKDGLTALELARASSNVGIAKVLEYLTPIFEEAKKKQAAERRSGAENWGKLRKVQTASKVANAFKTASVQAPPQSKSIFSSILSGDSIMEQGLGWLRGAASNLGESFRTVGAKGWGANSFSGFGTSFKTRNRGKTNGGSSVLGSSVLGQATASDLEA
jgi:hypothetical protein